MAEIQPGRNAIESGFLNEQGQCAAQSMLYACLAGSGQEVHCYRIDFYKLTKPLPRIGHMKTLKDRSATVVRLETYRHGSIVVASGGFQYPHCPVGTNP